MKRKFVECELTENSENKSPADQDEEIDDYHTAKNDQAFAGLSQLNPIDTLLLEKGFKKVEEIGRGIVGSAVVYQYDGKDPDILKLCISPDNDKSRKFLVIKRFLSEELKFQAISHNNIKMKNHAELKNLKDANGAILTYKNEIEIYQYLMAHSIHPIEKRKHLNAMVLQEGDVYCLLLEYVPYGQHKITNKLKSIDLKNFMGILSFNNMTPDCMKQILGESFLEMYNAIYGFHQLYILHLDIAARNFVVGPMNIQNRTHFLMRLKMIDLGLSKKLEANGRSTFEIDFDQCHIPFPSYIYDKNMLTQYYLLKEKNIKGSMTAAIDTDLFSTRVAMIEVLGYLLGMGEREIFSLKNENEKKYEGDHFLFFQKNRVLGFEEWKNTALNMSDMDRLTSYINNLKKRANERNDVHGLVVKEIIEYYSSYLLADLSQSPNMLADKLGEDKKLFTACHQKLSEHLKLNEEKMAGMFQQMVSIFDAKEISLNLQISDHVVPNYTQSSKKEVEGPRKNHENLKSPRKNGLFESKNPSSANMTTKEHIVKRLFNHDP